jgi:hypothetical protein
MFGKSRIPLRLTGLPVAALLACVGLIALELTLSVPAQAQFGRQGRPGIGGFFQQLFGPITRPPARQYQLFDQGAPPQHVDQSRAPPPPKRDEEVAPATSIVVMGDGMADWLAYGLEDAFSEAPEVAIVRQNERGSGLIRFDRKSDIDWWHHARELLAKEKADYVVVMLGIHDRQNIREKDVIEQAEKEAEEKKKQAEEAVQRALENAPGSANDENATDTDKEDAEKKDKSGKSDQKETAAAEPKKRKTSNAIFEFRSDQWDKIYSRRIDRMIAALKSKGVPVFWVGLPSIRGARSTADAVYLNDLFRVRAERAGIVYIDVWDGFVDEAGKFSSYGPDYEGQTRRLRASDGVFFTKYGARKLAHYVEREIRRFMNNRAVPVALPTGPLGPLPDGKSGVRPLAGPVIPLTVTPVSNEALAGAPGRHRVHGDTVAADALVRGDPLSAPPGRADDFAWPPGSGANRPQPAVAEPPKRPTPPQQPQRPKTSGVRDVTPLAAVPNVPASIAPVPKGPGAPVTGPAGPRKDTDKREGVATPDAAATPEPASPAAGNAAAERQAEIRPPQPVQNSAPRPARRANSPLDALFGRNGPFGWIPR